MHKHEKSILTSPKFIQNTNETVKKRACGAACAIQSKIEEIRPASDFFIGKIAAFLPFLKRSLFCGTYDCKPPEIPHTAARGTERNRALSGKIISFRKGIDNADLTYPPYGEAYK